MARVALSWVNRLDAAGVSFTAGSQVASLPASNLADPVVAKPWQTSGTVDTYVEIDLGSAQTVQLLALAGLVDFAATDTIRGRASTAKPTNLLWPSEDAAGANWSTLEASIVQDAGAAANGLTTADKIVESSATSTHEAVNASATVQAGSTVLATGVLQAAGRSRCRVQLYSGGDRLQPEFSLATGSVSYFGTSGAAVPVSARLVGLSGNRWRWEVVGIVGAATSLTLAIGLQDASGNNSYAGDGSSGLLTSMNGVYESSSFKGHVETTSAAATGVPDWFAEIDSASDLADTAGDVSEGYGIWAYLAAAAQSVRYVRFDLNAASLASQGYFRVGRGWAGPAWRPAVDAALGVESGWRAGSRLLEGARSGVVYPARRFVRRTARLALDALGEAEARDELLEMQRRAELAGQVLLVPSPGSARQNVEALLGYLRELPPVVQRLPALFGAAVEIEEAL